MDAAVSVSFEVPLMLPLLVVVMLSGLKLAVSPVGSPLVLSVTAELKLLVPVTLRIVLAELLCTTVTELGLAASVKVGVGTVTLTDAVLVTLPPAAVTVKV